MIAHARRLAALALLHVACGAEPAAAPAGKDADPLAGTHWRLVRIQSMDGAEFIPAVRDHYRLGFEPGGALTVRADCNRGRGAWRHDPPAGLELGPLAMTRMSCPPGSLHDRFVRDLDAVRSFVRQDGNLFLATWADGAILEMEPVPAGPRSGSGDA